MCRSTCWPVAPAAESVRPGSTDALGSAVSLYGWGCAPASSYVQMDEEIPWPCAVRQVGVVRTELIVNRSDDRNRAAGPGATGGTAHCRRRNAGEGCNPQVSRAT